MFLFYKNKGILVPVYFFVCTIGTAILFSLLKSENGGPFGFEYDAMTLFGLSTLLAGFWTYRTRDSFYVANGEKKRMFEDNSFFFIPMEIWAYLFFGCGTLCVVFGSLLAMGYLEK